ncbi:MAG: FecR domain-containing protein [Blastocatellia bacterium]|nr:FecR domain-containing protein [Blastocatellia bacterium]
MLFPRFSFRIPAALLAAALALPFWGAQSALAQSYAYDQDLEDQPPSRVGRISRLDGDAALRQPGSSQWADVDRNAPVFEGDEFFSSDNSRLEMQFGGGRYVRLGEDTDVVVAKLDTDSVRLELTVGSVIVSLRNFSDGDEFEISAPSAAVTVKDEGVYRIDVNDDGDTRVTVHEGKALVSTPDRSVQVDDGETASMLYGDPSQVDLVAWTGYDSFDSWSTGLDQDYARYDYQNHGSGDVSSAFNRSDIYGLAELALYGSWVSNSFGNCWVPRVGSGWSPYSNGYWQYYPGYGYVRLSRFVGMGAVPLRPLDLHERLRLGVDAVFELRIELRLLLFGLRLRLGQQLLPVEPRTRVVVPVPEHVGLRLGAPGSG